MTLVSWKICTKLYDVTFQQTIPTIPAVEQKTSLCTNEIL